MKRPIRIGNVSGAMNDVTTAMERMVRFAECDVIVGDWLSEMNIAWNAIAKRENPNLGYEMGFLTQLEGCIDDIVAQKMKVVTNAGALNVAALSSKVEQLCFERGHNRVVVASVLGDDITHLLGKQQFPHLDDPLALQDWELKAYSANAYIGCWGIVEALKAGADIVICGRVTDASPVIGAAAWWHEWEEDSFDELAGALVTGHLIECGAYACGSNFSGFKDYAHDLVDIGFPYADISKDGSCVIGMPAESHGTVNKFNITAQLLYELQGEIYLNPDVSADIRGVQIEETDKLNHVRVSGAIGLPPPPTTKAMIAGLGGYQAEATFYINGMDQVEKEKLFRAQLNGLFKEGNFSKLSIEKYGTAEYNARSQQAGTVSLRVFAQARKLEDINAARFRIPIYAQRMQSYPGYHMNLDFRTMDPKPFVELFPAITPYASIAHQVRVAGRTIDISPPSRTQVYPAVRPSYETAQPVPLESFGPTVRLPLGKIVHARSGDKANNSNIGFFVRHADEYPWLRSIMTCDFVKELFGDDWKNGRIERCEFPKVQAVHFRVLNFLDGGIASSSRLDGLGKGIGEYLRSRVVDLPEQFVARGTI